ncbi:hypothetical protein HYX03_03640 [Candidatus Woesearchaeota archaeon]|nr:hypothetical protein [Candidatus Woesearchaeota archaeon]
MNPEQLVQKKLYEVRGKDIKHPVGFGQLPKQVYYINRGYFIESRKHENGNKVYVFDNFVLYHHNYMPNGQLRLGACVTIDDIIEVKD